MKFTVSIASVRPHTLAAAIRSIQQQTVVDWELLVVGQGPDSAVEAVVAEHAAGDRRIKYIHIPEFGISRARNAAIAVAQGEILAFTDDDCIADSGWLAEIAACFEADPTLGLVAGATVAPPATRRGLQTCPAVVPSDSRYDPVASGRRPPAGWHWANANVAFRREIVARIGTFDPYLGAGTRLPAGEDTDYRLRMEAAGVIMRTTPRALVEHTYGRRYGLRAVLSLARNYAVGNAGVAAKLTLLGDVRGQQWYDAVRREALTLWIRERRPLRLPAHLLRFWHFARAYRMCLRTYRIDPRTSNLVPAGDHSTGR